MNITVYCGSWFGKDPVYKEAAIELGEWIAESGHTLYYGGSNVGLMGILADTTLAKGGKVIGIEPQFLMDQDYGHAGLTEQIVLPTMAERRLALMEKGDVMIALPGGTGTLDEISEAIVMVNLEQMDKPCVLYNVCGYYDLLEQFFDHAVREGFLTEENRAKILFARTIAEIEKIVQG